MSDKNNTNENVVVDIEDFKSLGINKAEFVNNLALENQELRNKLRDVSAVAIAMMYRTHPQNCSFANDFLQTIVRISSRLQLGEVPNMYSDGLSLANRDSVLDQYFSDIDK